MPKMIICAVRDRAVDAFGQPFFVRHEMEAMRSFGDEINRSGSNFSVHPDDYDLYRLGTYDDQTGNILPDDRPAMLSSGKSLVTPVV